MDQYFKIILLLGATFTFLMSVYLIFHPHKFYANRVLGALVFTWGFTVIGYVLGSWTFFLKYPHFYGVSSAFAILFFPLMYMYIRSYLYSDTRRFIKNAIHFIPVIIYILLLLPFYLKSGEAKIEIFKVGVPEWITSLQNTFDLVVIAQGVLYSVLSMRALHRFQYFRKGKLSKEHLASVKWLRKFVILNVFLWIIGASGAFAIIIGFPMPFDPFKVYYLGLTMLTILISIVSIKNPQFFAMKEDLVQQFYPAKGKGFQHLEESDDQEGYAILLKYFEDEKPYLKNDLKIKDLVEGTGLTNKRITEILLNEFDMSFFEVVNEYRSKEAIRLINDGFHKKHTLPHLGEEAGFNSKTNFNRIFKKYTGLTPTEYIHANNL